MFHLLEALQFQDRRRDTADFVLNLSFAFLPGLFPSIAARASTTGLRLSATGQGA